MREPKHPGGEPGKGVDNMTTATLTHAETQTVGLGAIFAALATAFALLYFAGFAEAAAFHDSAHDTRHTLAFPCH